MLTAAEAKFISDKRNIESSEGQLRQIEVLIARAIESGYYLISYESSLKKDVKETLEKLGYTIGEPWASGINETSIDIKW